MTSIDTDPIASLAADSSTRLEAALGIGSKPDQPEAKRLFVLRKESN